MDRLKVRPTRRQRLAESFETALRHADGRALAVEMDSGRRAPVLGALRLPAVQLLAAGARAAALLVQQPDGRLPALRRPRHGHLLRPEARGGLPAPVARLGRDQAAGTGATSSTSRCCRRSRSTTASTSRRPSRSCPAASRKWCSTAPARRRSRFAYLGERSQQLAARAPLRGHRPEPRAALPRNRLGRR